jgi:transcription antitermination factor NusG
VVCKVRSVGDGSLSEIRKQSVTRYGGALPMSAVPFSQLLTSPEVTPERPFWFAIQTRPRFEKKVTAELEGKRVEAFLPLHSATHQWSDRRRAVDLPLFPGYVFVRIAPLLHERVSVLRTNGVIGFVGARNVGIPIPDGEIEDIQAVLQRGVACEPYPYLKVGQSVRIRGGCLDGVGGVLMGVNGDRSLIISVNLIQRSVAVRIEGYNVEPI